MKLNAAINASTLVAGKNIYLVDADGNLVTGVKFSMTDSKTIKVTPPKEGYHKGCRYTLCLTHFIKSTDGRPLTDVRYSFVTK
ncbi:MAG: hypothetical protein N2376_13050 [Clostridia bacterium]|nr:hypothetical protein [Clostridia bacterium]